MLWDVAAGRRLKTFNGHWYAQRGQLSSRPWASLSLAFLTYFFRLSFL